MERISLGKSAVSVSRLCYGCDPIGGHEWGDINYEQAKNALTLAVDNGINFFDTADCYGLGRSEEFLGETLSGRRKEIVIATKFGVRIDSQGKTYYDNSAEWIKEAVTGSMKRLKTDYIDLYQIHYRDNKTPIDEVFGTLLELKGKGIIREIGLSNVYKESVAEFLPFKEHIVSFQNEYSLANRENEANIFSVSKKLSITPLTWGSLGQGVLTGKYNKNSEFSKDDRRSREIYKNFHEKLANNMEIVDCMKNISNETGKGLASIAIRWILDFIEGSIVICGIKNEQQLMSNLESINWTLSKDNFKLLDDISR